MAVKLSPNDARRVSVSELFVTAARLDLRCPSGRSHIVTQFAIALSYKEVFEEIGGTAIPGCWPGCVSAPAHNSFEACQVNSFSCRSASGPLADSHPHHCRLDPARAQRRCRSANWLAARVGYTISHSVTAVAGLVLLGWLASTLMLWWDTGTIGAAQVEEGASAGECDGDAGQP